MPEVVRNSTSIDGTTKIETEVSDLRAMAEILTRLGVAEVRYQENYREEWRWKRSPLTSTPGLTSRLSSKSKGRTRSQSARAAAAVGLDYAQARFGSVDEIYKSELGRDILAEPTLLFAHAREVAKARLFPAPQ